MSGGGFSGFVGARIRIAARETLVIEGSTARAMRRTLLRVRFASSAQLAEKVRFAGADGAKDVAGIAAPIHVRDVFDRDFDHSPLAIFWRRAMVHKSDLDRRVSLALAAVSHRNAPALTGLL
jgi:hypothetical protein